jgi:endonuclease YncB( thermonuclease family)
MFSFLRKAHKYSLSNTIPFIPPVTKGRVIKVYDGDTITIATTLKYKKNFFKTISQKYRFNVRLAGIDCAEIRTQNEDEKKVAHFSKYKLSELILNKKVRLNDVKLDKYGRLLAYVIYDDININSWMLEQNLAVKYDGKKKDTIDWLNKVKVDKLLINEFNKSYEEKIKQNTIDEQEK